MRMLRNSGATPRDPKETSFRRASSARDVLGLARRGACFIFGRTDRLMCIAFVPICTDLYRFVPRLWDAPEWSLLLLCSTVTCQNRRAFGELAGALETRECQIRVFSLCALLDIYSDVHLVFESNLFVIVCTLLPNRSAGCVFSFFFSGERFLANDANDPF